MYILLRRSHIRVELAYPAHLGIEIILKNYFAMNTRETGSRIREELASAASLGLGIIEKIIWPCKNVRRAPVYG